MKLNKRLSLVVGLCAFTLLSGLVLAQDVGPKGTASPAAMAAIGQWIGILKNPRVVDGCGCYFMAPEDYGKKPPSNKMIYESTLDTQTAYINLQGRDMTFKKVSGEAPKEAKKGTQFSLQYLAYDIKATIDLVVKQVCPPKDESCEVTNYDATLSVDTGSAHQTMKLSGDCGC